MSGAVGEHDAGKDTRKHLDSGRVPGQTRHPKQLTGVRRVTGLALTHFVHLVELRDHLVITPEDM